MRRRRILTGIAGLATLVAGCSEQFGLTWFNSDKAERDSAKMVDQSRKLPRVDDTTDSEIIVGDPKHKEKRFREDREYPIINGALYVPMADLPYVAGKLGIDISVKYFNYLLPGDNISVSRRVIVDKGLPTQHVVTIPILTQDISGDGSFDFHDIEGFDFKTRISTVLKSITDLDKELQERTGINFTVTSNTARPYQSRYDNYNLGGVFVDNYLGNGNWDPQGVPLPMTLGILKTKFGFGKNADVVSVYMDRGNPEKDIYAVIAFANNRTLGKDPRQNMILSHGFLIGFHSLDTPYDNLIQTIESIARLPTTIQQGITGPVKGILDDWDAIKGHFIEAGGEGYLERLSRQTGQLNQIGQNIDDIGHRLGLFQNN